MPMARVNLQLTRATDTSLTCWENTSYLSPASSGNCYKLVCPDHTLPETSCSCSPPPIVAARDVAEKSQKKKKKIPIFFLNIKTFDIILFTTNSIRKRCFGNSVWAGRTKRCTDHTSWPAGHYPFPLLYGNSGDQSSAGKEHPLPQSSLAIRVTQQ